MSRRLLRLEVPVFPDGLKFRVHDPAADLDGLASPARMDGSLISTSRDQLVVACAQGHVGVQVTIEEWDDAPPPFSDGYEDEAKCVLYLRGKLSVDTGPVGRAAVEAVRLCGGVGDYSVHLYTRNRAEAAASYAGLYEQYRDPLGDEFQQARKELAGTEQYLIQLWRES